MIEQDGKRRMVRLLVTGLAVAAVAGVAIAGTAVARSRQSAGDTAAAGGPDIPSPAALATRAPAAATPTTPPAPVAVPTSQLPAGAGRTPAASKPVIQKPAMQEPPANPVAACKTWLKDAAGARGEPAPGPNAKVVARLDGAPGTVLILADSKYWAGCDTAFARNGSQGSIRQPAKIAKPAPGDAEAFTVANNLISIKGKQYEYYWSAGQLPSGVASIAYTFPDGRPPTPSSRATTG